jgi:hypothetical protein
MSKESKPYLRMIDFPTARKRSCADCRSCCDEWSSFVVSDGKKTVKASYAKCVHLTEKGCGIYDSRPVECAGWACAWRLGFGSPDDRPDKQGYYIDLGVDAVAADVESIKAKVKIAAGAMPALVASVQTCDVLKWAGGGVDSAFGILEQISKRTWSVLKKPIAAELKIRGVPISLAYALRNGEQVAR